MTIHRDQMLLALAYAAPKPLNRVELFRKMARVDTRLAKAVAEDLTRIGFLKVDEKDDFRLTEAGVNYVERRFQHEPKGKFTAYNPIAHGPRLPPASRELEEFLTRRRRRALLQISLLLALPIIITIFLIVVGDN
ncbi:MAG: hypothetical protein ACT4OE_11750 [Sphingosinicella sp.]